MTLTRADLEARRLHHMIEQAGLDRHVWSEAELRASISAMLQGYPSDQDIWIFAYGSLIWNPIFRFLDRQVGSIYGWHRQFCLWAPLGRGTPDRPGLVLGLERGGSCRGIVYRLSSTDALAELLLVWRREMVIGSYIPRWVRVFQKQQSVRAMTFTINPAHPDYACKLSQSRVAHHVATACGQLGPCADYLQQTVVGLAQAGIRDQRLEALQKQVVAIQQCAAVQPIPKVS